MFQINLNSRIPIYEQLYNKIIELVMKGQLKEEDQIPSVRSLAKELGVNPNTVQKAYQELERNGIIFSVTGRGNFIAPIDKKMVAEKALDNFDKAVVESLKLGFSKEDLIVRIKEISYD
ncbi:GntR family transcriptional regulator [Clostridium sp. Marseille-P299]|uniref:GntR family transcriptional regulator n=1 Tax=Clostridium sp. Marseille-P299 TaxID=1805477 RepID=UPI00082BF051|nr:GntR family transcriptional regulator [Clostridium sp. Marseille-P299]